MFSILELKLGIEYFYVYKDAQLKGVQGLYTQKNHSASVSINFIQEGANRHPSLPFLQT